MARQIKDVTQNGAVSEVRARLSDTYSRPLMRSETQLDRIADALTAANPVIAKFLIQRKDKNDAMDMAVGAELYRKLMAEHGKDLSASEIGAMVKNGDVEGFSHLNKMQEQGIIRERHRLTGQVLAQHMLEWQSNATVKDANGNDVPLSTLADPNDRIRHYTSEAERFIQEQTKGKYDPVLYEEYIRPALTNTVDHFISQSAKAVIAERQAENTKIAEIDLDNKLTDYINNGTMFKQPQEATKDMVDFIDNIRKVLTGIDKGFSKLESLGVIAQWFSKIFADGTVDADYKDWLKEVMEQIPDLMTGELGVNLSENASRGISYSVQMSKYAKERRKDAIETEISLAVYDLINSDKYSPAELNALMTTFSDKYPDMIGEIGKEIKAIADIKNNIDTLGYEMPANEFRDIELLFMQGKGSNRLLQQLASKVSSEQWLYLDQLLGITISNAKQQAQATGDTPSLAKIRKVMGQTYKMASGLIKQYNTGSTLDPHDINQAPIRLQMEHELQLKLMEFKHKNPNATPVEEQLYAIQATKEVLNNYDAAVVKAAEKNPELLRASAEERQAVANKQARKDLEMEFKPNVKNDAKITELRKLSGLVQKGDTNSIIKWANKNLDRSKPLYQSLINDTEETIDRLKKIQSK